MAMGKIIRRSMMGLLIASAAAMLAFGPRGDDKRPRDRITITYWEKWGGNEGAQMKQIVDEFNATVGKEKSIFVEYLSMSKVDQKTLVATAAGVPPDVCGLWSPMTVQFASLGALEPLEDLARQHGITEKTYKPIYWKACNWNRHLYCLVSTPMATALHYNKAIFYQNADKLRAAGLDPTRAPRTLEELDHYAEVLDKHDPAHPGRIDRSGFLPMEPGWYINYQCLHFGANWYDPATERLTMTNPGMLQTYQWIESYSKRLGKDSLTEFSSAIGNFNSPQNAFLADKVAMEIQGPWMANFIENLTPTKARVIVPKVIELFLPRTIRPFNYEIGVAPYPSPASMPDLKDVAFVQFDTLAIPKGSKHVPEAFEFIAYVHRQDVMEKLNSLHCKNSPLAEVSDDFVRKHPNPYIEVFEKLAASPNAGTDPQFPILPEVTSELLNVSQLVSTLEQTPAQALGDCQKRMQERLDLFREKAAAREKATGVKP